VYTVDKNCGGVAQWAMPMDQKDTAIRLDCYNVKSKKITTQDIIVIVALSGVAAMGASTATQQHRIFLSLRLRTLPCRLSLWKC
jgi:galactokinase